jgi:hypothetical protein
VFSLCRNVIRHCDELVAVSNLDTKQTLQYETLKADLLMIARRQVLFLISWTDLELRLGT